MTIQEQNREIDNRGQITDILAKITREKNITGERLQIVQADLEWGLSEEDVERYDNKMSLERMRCMSVCMRKRVPKNIENMVLEGDFTPAQAEMIAEIYNQIMAEREALDNAVTAGFIEVIGQCEEIVKTIKEAKKEILTVVDKPTPEPVVVKQDVIQPMPVEPTVPNPIPIQTSMSVATPTEEKIVEADYATEQAGIVEVRRTPVKTTVFEKITGMPPLISTLIKRVAKGELNESHLAVIKDALTAGLSDKLIIRLLNANTDAKKMRDLVDLSIKYRTIEKEALV